VIISGNPDPEKICTSHVERNNLTMRMQIRRLTRLTNCFSKKWENHRSALALHFAYYNFCRIHGSIRVTPAMEAGITDHVWTFGGITRPRGLKMRCCGTIMAQGEELSTVQEGSITEV
jgi:hypothetical protein